MVRYRKSIGSFVVLVYFEYHIMYKTSMYNATSFFMFRKFQANFQNNLFVSTFDKKFIKYHRCVVLNLAILQFVGHRPQNLYKEMKNVAQNYICTTGLSKFIHKVMQFFKILYFWKYIYNYKKFGKQKCLLCLRQVLIVLKPCTLKSLTSLYNCESCRTLASHSLNVLY